MSGNYREYGYDVNSPQLSRQIQEDINEAKEIEKRAEEIRSEKIAKYKLGKDEVSEKEIETVLSSYSSNEKEYLVDGAVLMCDKAKRGAVKVNIGNTVVERHGAGS